LREAKETYCGDKRDLFYPHTKTENKSSPRCPGVRGIPRQYKNRTKNPKNRTKKKKKKRGNHHPVAQKCAEFLDGLEKAREHFAAHFRHHHAPRLAPGPKKKYFQRYIKTFAAHYCYHHATRLALGPDVCERERERERERGRERERERERT